MNRALVTYATGEHEEFLEIALPSFHEFADRHDYDVVVAEPGPSTRPPSWLKVPALKAALEDGYEEAVWVDADIVIVDPTVDLDVPDDAWQALVRHHTGDGEVPNCGVWVVRQPMIPVLDTIWAKTQYFHHGWWEQAAMLDLLGYKHEPRPATLTEPTELYERTYWLDNGFNVHLRDMPLPENPRWMHATMVVDRVEAMRQWAEVAAREAQVPA